MAVLPFTMIKIIKRCPYHGEKAQIIFPPKKGRRRYGAQIKGSLDLIELKRKDFIVIHSAKTRAR